MLWQVGESSWPMATHCCNLIEQWKHSHRHFIEDGLFFVANLNAFQLLCGFQLNSVL